ncbi:hypothetical protein QVD17_19059 [Tagetes erecta]|uniref:Uncharacterized protein n=1 Tax=Tagetes erecta TaxID=13708 RepID=A0AAD8NWW8_TARER|nr:hypothetical protein QVD17_19059 [Tagetes erecta]
MEWRSVKPSFRLRCPVLGALFLIQSQLQVFPPETKCTADAPNLAQTKLDKMSPSKGTSGSCYGPCCHGCIMDLLFALLIGSASQLTTLGLVPWLSKCVAKFLKSLSVGWHLEILILQTAKVRGTLSALLLAYRRIFSEQLAFKCPVKIRTICQ